MQATSKSVVRTVCQEAFVHRNGAGQTKNYCVLLYMDVAGFLCAVPEMTLAAIANALGIEPKQSVKVRAPPTI